MPPDLLAGASWACCATSAHAAGAPDELDKLPFEWVPASVPGTAAGALAAASGRRFASTVDFDSSDWWFRCQVPAGGGGRWTLLLDGLATVADVWFRGAHVLHSENMFVSHSLDVDDVAEGDDLVIRFAALTPLLGVRRPRPRWKTQMATHQSLRWFRTTFLGRQPGWTVTPAPVGPWRPVRLEPAAPVRVVERRVIARCEADSGVVSVSLRLAGLPTVPENAVVRVRRIDPERPAAAVSVDAPLTVRAGPAPGAANADADANANANANADDDGNGDIVVEGDVVVPDVERWWPHTHGPQPRYAVTVDVGSETVDVGRVGFRTVEVDRFDGGFRLVVNGVPVFCRGACWWPIDPVTLQADDEDLSATLELVTSAHMNMVRIPGGTVYEDERFWDRCDEVGVLVWQDCMFGYVDPPEDEEFEAAAVAELEEVFGRLGGRPSLAVVCGAQEIEEQAAMFGLPRDRWGCPLIERVIPDLVEKLLPGVPYVSSSPTGGDLPFQPDAGDCHYWGVGSYLRPADDARRCGIRFMSEGLAFATPPERQTVEEECGGAVRAGHDPGWKQALHHDTGRSWDLEDVRDFYVGEILGVDPHLLRYLDPERALDLGRAVVAELLGRTLGEWRRPGSTCDGGLVVALRDLAPGAGWGVIDALGRPKAPWFSLKRVLAPVAVIGTDEGMNGLHLHLMNDTDELFSGELTIDLFARGELKVEDVARPVDIPARGHLMVEAGSLFDGFRDLTYAHRFGPAAYDVVAAALKDGNGRTVSDIVHLPAGLDRPFEPDVGLEATARPGTDDGDGGNGGWTVTVTSRRLAQWVVVEVPGYRPSDSWFHLAPGQSRTLTLHGYGNERPSGQVRALNSQATARIAVV